MMWFILLLISLLLPLAAGGQHSRCADCHFANLSQPSPYGSRTEAKFHLDEWHHSAHGRNEVGCDACHGGDPTTFDPARAHENILSSQNPASPAHRQNLPQTCGRCHLGPLTAFKKSGHYELLRAGNDDAPTCSTCHGSVAAHLLSPKGLLRTCAKCHPQSGVASGEDHASQGQRLLEGVRAIRASLEKASPLIRRIQDEERQARLQQAYEQAEVPLTQAVDAGHSFVFNTLEERLEVAHQRVEALLEQLVNPPARRTGSRKD